LGARQVQHAEIRIVVELRRGAPCFEQYREEPELRINLRPPTEDRGFLPDPVRLADCPLREEDDRRVTFGEPLVQTVLPVVTRTQALVIDDDLDPVAVDLHQLLADRLQELPVRLCLRVARLAGAPARAVADEDPEGRHVGFVGLPPHPAGRGVCRKTTTAVDRNAPGAASAWLAVSGDFVETAKRQSTAGSCPIGERQTRKAWTIDRARQSHHLAWQVLIGSS
jgi:hypothetical protein